MAALHACSLSALPQAEGSWGCGRRCNRVQPGSTTLVMDLPPSHLMSGVARLAESCDMASDLPPHCAVRARPGASEAAAARVRVRARAPLTPACTRRGS